MIKEILSTLMDKGDPNANWPLLTGERAAPLSSKAPRLRGQVALG